MELHGTILREGGCEIIKNKAIFWGLISVLSPIPLTILSFFWDWIWCFGIVMGPLGYERIPDWALILGTAPLLISPVIGYFGIVYGICHYRQRLAWLGILLSFLGVVVNGLLIFGILYTGSQF